MKPLKRHIYCPQCRSHFKLPVLWILGFETILRCPNCRKSYKTGRKMGAMLFALSLALSLGLSNALCSIFPGALIPMFTLLGFILWICLGWMLRRAYLNTKIKLVKKK